ncbi:hypothetical protein J6590_023532 [Homalodisca vitripennis]|nr:hypothetical protein J6590_023532 [Homalodisca vitripennis]
MEGCGAQNIDVFSFTQVEGRVTDLIKGMWRTSSPRMIKYPPSHFATITTTDPYPPTPPHSSPSTLGLFLSTNLGGHSVPVPFGNTTKQGTAGTDGQREQAPSPHVFLRYTHVRNQPPVGYSPFWSEGWALMSTPSGGSSRPFLT